MLHFGYRIRAPRQRLFWCYAEVYERHVFVVGDSRAKATP